MKRVLIPVSFVLVFFVAFLSSRTFGVREVEAGEDRAVKRETASAEVSERIKVPEMSFRGHRAEDYRVAWDAIPERRLRTVDRRALQIEILRAWGEVDFDGAVAAALNENWNPRNGWKVEEVLGKAFREIFEERPFEIWEKIKAGEFGELESGLVRTAWMNAVMAEDAKMLMPLLAELDPTNQQRLVSEVLNTEMSAEDVRKIWESLKTVNEGALEVPLLHVLSAQKLTREEILELVDEGGLVAKTATAALARQIAKESLSVENLQAAESLPEELRGGFVYQFMLEAWDNPEVAKASLDQLVAMADWELAGSRESVDVVKDLSRAMDSAELASWAVALPQREEAKELFDRGIENYLHSNRDSAWEWIGQFDEGMWRDRAYAEFSQQSLNHFNDPERSEEAVSRINDPTVKNEALEFRKAWENRPDHGD